jgi:hypothetical protein
MMHEIATQGLESELQSAVAELDRVCPDSVIGRIELDPGYVDPRENRGLAGSEEHQYKSE